MADDIFSAYYGSRLGAASGGRPSPYNSPVVAIDQQTEQLIREAARRGGQKEQEAVDRYLDLLRKQAYGGQLETYATEANRPAPSVAPPTPLVEQLPPGMTPPTPSKPPSVPEMGIPFGNEIKGGPVNAPSAPIRAATMPDGRIVFTNQPSATGGTMMGDEMAAWKANAISTQPEGPFSVREGAGGYSPSTPVPDVSGMSAQEFMKAEQGQSPLVRDMMEEQRAKMEATARAELERKALEMKALTPEQQAIQEVAGYQKEQELIRQALQPDVDNTVKAMIAANPKLKPQTPEQLKILRDQIEQKLFAQAWNQYMMVKNYGIIARSGFPPSLGPPEQQQPQ